MKKIIRMVQFSLVICLSLVLVNVAAAKDLKASLALLPGLAELGADGQPKGQFVDLIKAIDELYEEGNISITISPFPRSIDNVLKGKADFHYPLLRNPDVSPDVLPYAMSTASLFYLRFNIYYNKKHAGFTKEMVKDTGKYKVETERGHAKVFDFAIRPSDSIKASLKKVNMGRIDAYVFSSGLTGKQLNVMDAKDKANIKIELYDWFESIFVLPKNNNTDEIDRILSSAIEKLKENGKLKQILGDVAIERP